MDRRLHSVIVVIIFAIIGLQLAAYANPYLEVQLVWEHSQPETVKYYNIYISDIQGQYNKPYARITRLPTDRRGVPLKIPIIPNGSTVTRHVVVTAVDAIGVESGYSNEIKLDANLGFTDLGVP